MIIPSQPPGEVQTVIIGGGPASLILAYILHGHIPYYRGNHRDKILDSKLRSLSDLLHITPELWSHFSSDMKYSSQALPINTLLDTLVRPDADTEILPQSCIEWRYEPQRAVSHMMLSSARNSGGQWVSTEGDGIEKAATLSYAELLSLPGYSFTEHYSRQCGTSEPPPDRPSRKLVASYYAAYPSAVGISDSIYTDYHVYSVVREGEGFSLSPAKQNINVRCKYLVLGTGVFGHSIAPPSPISMLTKFRNYEMPLLVVGSGFSAADAIVSCPPQRKVIHIYKWDPTKSPSPLRGCHQQAYPEYAKVYRQMKVGTGIKVPGNKHRIRSSPTNRQNNLNCWQRDWDSTYLALPNAFIEDFRQHGSVAIVRIRQGDGRVNEHLIGSMKYLVGRRGSLSYLDSSLQKEVFGNALLVDDHTLNQLFANISRQSLRANAEVDTEVAPSMFIIGSLTGDSLVRHAFGSSVYAAGRIFGAIPDT